MLLEKFQPHILLQPYIKTYLVIACEEESTNRILPDTGITLAFRFKGAVEDVTGAASGELPPSMISGLRKSPRLIRYTPGSGNVLVLFREAGAAAFFRHPLHELFGTNIPLDHFTVSGTSAGIETRLADAAGNGQRIAIVEQFLMSRLQHAVPDKLIEAALEMIHAARGTLKIKELAAALYISQDAFEKRFRKTVGTSPKQYCSLVRMQAVIARGNKDETLTGIAFDAGYSDQSHFNKEFKIFTGQSPTDFFLTPPRW